MVAVMVPLAILGCAPVPAPAQALGRDASLFVQPWHWTDERGAEVTFAAWQGVPLVVAMFFTSCTTRCPLTVEKLRDVDEAFRRKGAPAQFLLVTLDPATDSSERLARFKTNRHLPDAWHVLRGSLEDTRALGRVLGVRAMFDDGHIDHDVRIAIFDRTGRRVRDFATWDFDPDRAVVLPTEGAHPVIPPPPATRGPFAVLRKLLEGEDLRSIEALLARLPAPLRERHVLVYDSRSVQGASALAPRVLLYTPDARFVVAYNGDPGQAGYQSLETMEFDDGERAFRFREVTFPEEGAQGRAVFSEANPPRCLACHGEDPRPIWDTYPAWPGVYGARDHAAPDPAEAAALAAFVERRSSNPRYRWLEDVQPEATSAATESSAAYEGKDHRLSRNAQFGLLLQALAYHTIAREVIASSRFGPFRYALLASLDPSCLGIEGFVPESVRAAFPRSLDDVEHVTSKANAAQDAAKAKRAKHPDIADTNVPRETLTPFRYLVEEGLRIETRDWTLALEKSTFDFTSPRRPTRILERDLLAAIAPLDPGLPALQAADDHRDGYCVALRKRSLSALAPPPVDADGRGPVADP